MSPEVCEDAFLVTEASLTINRNSQLATLQISVDCPAAAALEGKNRLQIVSH